jgi:hypothetical protein
MTETRGSTHTAHTAYSAHWSARKGLRLVGIASLGLSALLFVLPHSASATTNGLTEQAGLPSPFSNDGTPASPDVDITALSDTYENGQITLTLQTVDPIDPTASGTSYFVNWGIWVDGNSDPTKLDYVVQFGNDGLGDQQTQILNSQSVVQACTVDTSFADQQFSMAFPASCIASPTSIEVAAFVETDDPTVPTDVQYDVTPDGVDPDGFTACCEATDTTTSSSTTTSSTAITSTSTTARNTTTTSTVPSTSTTTSASPTTSTTTSTVPSTSTTTTAASTTTTTTAAPTTTTTTTTTTTSPTSTTTTTAPSTTAATSIPTTTTTNPVQLAGSTVGSGGGSTGGSAAPSGGGSSATEPSSTALAFTGINGTVLRWILLLGGLLMLVGSMGRRWAVVRIRAARELSWRGGGALLLVTVSVIGTAAAVHTTANAARRGHNPSNASPALAVPRDDPLEFGRTDLNPTGQPGSSPHLAQSTVDSIESHNWSGYVATASQSSPITDVQGSWAVPNVALSWTPTYSAAWIGIDGGESDDLQLAQIGTEQDSFFGFTSYSAWWSTADQDYLAVPITDSEGLPFTVDPGDTITAGVDQSPAGQVFFTLGDSNDESAAIVTGYQGTGLTAEWVLEAPTILNGTGTAVATLANYGSTVFDDLSTNEQLNSVDLSNDE